LAVVCGFSTQPVMSVPVNSNQRAARRRGRSGIDIYDFSSDGSVTTVVHPKGAAAAESIA
jgi:hypothetical protein